MHEALVQWTLLNNRKSLSEYLDFNISMILGQEITTNYGRIDFILEDDTNRQLVVELETTLNTKSKLDYCFRQVLNYKNIQFTKNAEYCILFAEETLKKNKQQITEFGEKENVIIKTYPLTDITRLYDKTIHRLSLNVGLALPNPKNYTICYLRWLNKILFPFMDGKTEKLKFNQIYKPFSNNSNSKTNFNCHVRLALDFEMIDVLDKSYYLTNNGKEYIEGFNIDYIEAVNISSVELTKQQKRLLLKVLTNGNWENKVHKVNIYWFLRFLEVTNGNWLPKKHNFDKSKLEIANGLFNVSYKSRTMQEFLTWCSNYCVELCLIEKVKSTSAYDQIVLTPLGVEINNLFSLDLTLKKARLNLNFKQID